MNNELRIFCTKDGFIRMPDGILEPNTFGEYWFICAEVIYHNAERSEMLNAKWLRFTSTPSTNVEKAYHEFSEEVIRMMKTHEDQAVSITQIPKILTITVSEK